MDPPIQNKTITITTATNNVPIPLPLLPVLTDSEEDSPVPGTPTVVRVFPLPSVKRAPRGPTEVEMPDLLRFSVTPGAILMRRQNLNPITGPRDILILCRGYLNRPSDLSPCGRVPGYCS